MDKGTLIVFYGGSKSGKSTLLDKLEAEGIVSKVTKYSTRKKRTTNDDITTGSLSNCDIRYSLNNNEYGFNTTEIWELINSGKNVGIILSDIDSIKKLKDMFKNILVYYIIIKVETFEELLNKETDRMFSIKDDTSISEPIFQEAIKSQDFNDAFFGCFLGITEHVNTMEYLRIELESQKSKFSQNCELYKDIEALIELCNLPLKLRKEFLIRVKGNSKLHFQYKSNPECFDGVLENYPNNIDLFFANSMKIIGDALDNRRKDDKSK